MAIRPERRHLRTDAIAGLVGAVSSVPDGMASAILAGVSPIQGLSASIVGPIVGGLLVAAPLMVVTTTTAGALSGRAAVAELPEAGRTAALVLLVLLAGLVQVAAGALRLGRLAQFVSHSVMVGFLTGVAVLIVLGQIGTLTGTQPEGATALAKAGYVLTHLDQVDLASVAVGAVAIVIAVLPVGARFRQVAPLVAIAVPSLAVAALSLDVETVADVGPVSGGLPLPALPSLDGMSIPLVTGALAVAAIILVQGAGVAESLPIEGGRPSRPSRDFAAQGAANVASSLFQGIPVGGSVGQTALSVSAGARTRWATILSGLFLLAIVVAFGQVVGFVPMPALAGLLVVAGIHTINVDEAAVIWRTGAVSRLSIVVTGLATLFLPIQVAVGIGVLLSTVLYLNAEASDVSIVELVELPDGGLEERRPGTHLESGRATILDVYGSLFYAGARTFARRLPAPEGADRPVVILRLRGRTKVGATFVEIVHRYAGRLRASGGVLYLSGVDDRVRDQIVRSGKLRLGDEVRLEAVTPVLGESTRRALGAANAWLATDTQP